MNSIDQITKDIEAGIKRAVPARRAVPPQPTVEDVGRLTGEALAMSYEAAAKQIEEMGRHLTEEIKGCEQSVLDMVKELDGFKAATRQAVEQCELTARAYREEARHLSSHVQDRCAAADDVRKLCDQMIAKIRIPTGVAEAAGPRSGDQPKAAGGTNHEAR